jgi:hypothetical protein
MSYRIEYQWAAFHVPGAPLGLSEDRYIVAIEGGDNNCYEIDTNRRTRAWDACMAGTHTQVLRQAVYYAGACEGGCLKPKGRACTPESYIRRIRRLLEGAVQTPAGGYWHARLRAQPDHPAVRALIGLGLQAGAEVRHGSTRALVDVPPEHHAAYFRLLDRHGDDWPAWHWFEVFGLSRF